ncbi:MAG TPA: ABC transporter permease [Anaerolineae bacterium]|nr:ABC transporter permease [Anaerolineae bacterium]
MDVTIDLAAATLRVATPILFAALGELYCERAGILNLGIEGTMFIGALAGFLVSYVSQSVWLGLLAAIVAGLLFGALMALLTVRLGLNQHVSGLGTTLLASGLALFIYRLTFGAPSVQPKSPAFPLIEPPAIFGPLAPLFKQYGLTYVALALVPLTWWILRRTTFGLKLRAVGENPEAADTAGVNVFRVRYAALMIGGALMAVGGAFLSLAQLGTFTFGIIAGRGWVAIALVIFGNWQAFRVFGAALLFGALSVLQLRLQAEGVDIPYQALLALPYLVTILALAVAGRNASYPAALLKPYRRE